MYWPVWIQSNINDNSNGLRLNNWAKSYKIINALSLDKTFGNWPSFITINVAIWLIFEFKNPYATNNVCLRGWWNKGPCLIFHLVLVLICHNLFECAWLNRWGDNIGLLDDASVRPCYHRMVLEGLEELLDVLWNGIGMTSGIIAWETDKWCNYRKRIRKRKMK